MRMILVTALALGFASVVAIGTPSPTQAQGYYSQGRGIAYGVGRPRYRDRYYRAYKDRGDYGKASVGRGPDCCYPGDSWDRMYQRNRFPSWAS